MFVVFAGLGLLFFFLRERRMCLDYSRISQISLLLLAKNVISKVLPLCSDHLLSLFLDSSSCTKQERKFLGLSWNKGVFYVVDGCGSSSHERETSC